MSRVFHSAVSGLLVVALSAAGCAGEKPAKETATERPKVAIVLSSTNVSSVRELGAGFNAGAQDAGGEAIVTGPPINDPPKQAELFKEATASAKGGVSIQASNAELIAGQLAQAGKDGVPLIAVGIKPAPTSGVKTYVGADGQELGRQLADELAKKLAPDSKGTIVLGLTRPGVTVHDDRGAGVREGLAAKLPGVRVLGPFETGIDAAANLAAWRRLITANPSALAFVGSGATDSISLATVRAEGTYTWLAAAFDTDPKGLKGIQDGHLLALVSPEHYLQGLVAGWLQVHHAKTGKALPHGWIRPPGLMVTPANVAEIIQRQESEATKVAWFKPYLDKITANLPTYTKPLDQAG